MTPYFYYNPLYYLLFRVVLIPISPFRCTSDSGYGEYIEGDKYTNVYLNVDPAHKFDSTLGYISYSNGEFYLTPKLHSGTNIEIVNNNVFFGFSTGHTTRHSLRGELEETILLGDYWTNILNKLIK